MIIKVLKIMNIEVYRRFNNLYNKRSDHKTLEVNEANLSKQNNLENFKIIR